MNYQEAEARFQWLESQRAARRMTEQTYRDEVHQIRVVDEWGRHWMLQERTGQWHVYDGTQWIPATPPPQPPPPPSQPGQPPPLLTNQTATPRAPLALAERRGCLPGKMAVYLAIWLVGWISIAGVVYLIVARDEPTVLVGVAVAALLSLVLMLGSLAGQWQGQIVELKVERVRVQRGEDDWDWEDQTMAYIRQPNGRIRKLRAMNDWQVGDRLDKRRGEAYIRVTK